jgi:hypothetical protein
MNWRTLPRSRKYRYAAALIAILTATWLTLAGQYIMVLAEQRRVSFDWAFPIGMLWLGFIVAPAQIVAWPFGWHWVSVTTLNGPQLVMVLVVNVLLWGVIGGLIGQFYGYCLSMLKKDSAHSTHNR